MIVAINQPYFSPYAGYYSLIRAADIFVVYDCVQFARRGRVHRSEIHQSAMFSAGWLTLPLEKQPQDTMICDIQAKPWTQEIFQGLYGDMLSLLGKELDIAPYFKAKYSLGDFLMAHHRAALQKLNIDTKIIRSSTLNIAQNLRGQERIIAICKKLDAHSYINLPGGRSLYEHDAFKNEEIALQFLDTDHCSRLGYLQALAEGCFDRFQAQSMSAPLLSV